MLSEWMTECPKDLATNWYALACPKGSRVLIVAAKVYNITDNYFNIYPTSFA